MYNLDYIITLLEENRDIYIFLMSPKMIADNSQNRWEILPNLVLTKLILIEMKVQQKDKMCSVRYKDIAGIYFFFIFNLFSEILKSNGK